MKNLKIADIFNNIADILEVKDENPFRVRAYRKAALTLEGLSEDIEDLLKANKLEALPGIGKDLALKIEEYITTGRLKSYEDLKKKVSKGTIDLMGVPGIGPRTAKALVSELKVKGIADLEKKIKSRKLKKLPGIKEKTFNNILRGIEFLKKGKGRTALGVARPIAKQIIAKLEKLPGVKRCEVAGSLRRMKDTIRDIDILVVSKKRRKVMDAFVGFPEVKDVLAHGDTKSSCVTKNGIQVDVRAVGMSSFGAAWMYFTGSKSHNIKLRKMAISEGMKLNEYGLFRGRTDKRIAASDEKKLYAALGLTFIPPEMREDTGEIELSLKNKLPKLTEIRDIKGDFHVHSNYSDASSSIEDMARAAMKKGYQYIAITDHSKSLRIARGLTERRLLKQIKEIRALNKKFSASERPFRILTGSEVDILSDGRLDFKDSILKELDFVIAALHTGFKQSKEAITSRIIKAMENKFIHMIAHLTGRLIGIREGYEVDVDKIIRAAKRTGTVLEINAYPLRLDLNDLFSRQAKEAGVLLAIGTDAHETAQLDMMEYGLSVARRGWLTRKDVLNTRPLNSLLEQIGP